MTPHEPTWTCPFCPLLCDGFGATASPSGWTLEGSDCSRARSALTHFDGRSAAAPRIDGVPCLPEEAILAAADLLGRSSQPLFGGLGTDTAGARALYALACRTGAICEPAEGRALMHGVRALQDKGAFTTSLGEVRTRADLILFVGSLPTVRYPELGARLGATARRVWLDASEAYGTAAYGTAAQGIERVAFQGDLFDAVASLAASVSGRASGPLDPLAQGLRDASYAVLVHETGELPLEGALVVETLNRIVSSLNVEGRAASLTLGGGHGAATVNAAHAWLSGLPLRSRAGPFGLEHEPLRFDAGRLLADHAVDALLWIASFGTEPAMTATDLPQVLLGHPRFAADASGAGSVFIPVSTPGVGSAGHLFRTDGSLLMPLRALRDDRLPSVAEVLRRLLASMERGSA